MLGAGPGVEAEERAGGKERKAQNCPGINHLCVSRGHTPRSLPNRLLDPLSRYCSSTFPGKDWAGLGQWGWAERGEVGEERDRKQYQAERGRERGSKRGRERGRENEQMVE